VTTNAAATLLAAALSFLAGSHQNGEETKLDEPRPPPAEIWSDITDVCETSSNRTARISP